VSNAFRFPDWEQFQDDVRKHKKVADKAWKVKKNEGRNISMLSAKARVKVEKTLAAGSESQAYLRKLKTQENSIWIRETALKFISRMPAANQVASLLIYSLTLNLGKSAAFSD